VDIASLWKEILKSENPDSYKQLEIIRKAVIESSDKAEVSFGTSGWRGELGVEFTYRNVQIVAKAILKMYETADTDLLEVLGVANFQQFKDEGVLLGHDNRMMGHDFCRIVGSVFRKAGVRVLYAGEATTPEFSAGVEQFNTACAVNVTPSHNPANYSGFKFNPKDGGPAGPEITEVITILSNEMMPSEVYTEMGECDWEEIDILKAYKEFFEKRKTINFAVIERLIQSGDLTLAVDHVHGATRKRPDYLLNFPSCLITIRTEDDFLFGKIAPEPSSKNMQKVKTALDQANSKFKLGAIYDPDGDRIRFYDGSVEVDMNRFGAMALHYMVTYKKLNGVLAKSVATSNFANNIAKALNIGVVETAVGFKNFRPNLVQGANPMALVAFEESDGISGYNNTIEKDAQFGLLLALEMIAVTGKSLGEYLKELQNEYGYFYPERMGFEVEKAMAGAPLVAKVNALEKRVATGQEMMVGTQSKVIAEVLTLDGIKIIFEDASWMLIRPSGTEPKVRIYTECRKEEEKTDMFEAAKALFFA
jgi:phosphomannomutase